MSDIEKIVEHLYDCLAASKPDNLWVFVRKDIVGDSIALLKEQGEQIKNRDESLEKAREEIKWLRGMLKERNDNFDLYDTPIFGFHD